MLDFVENIGSRVIRLTAKVADDRQQQTEQS